MKDRVFAAWEWIFAPDPGFNRLVAAGKMVLAATIVLFAILAWRRFATIPPAAVALAFIVTMLGSVAVRDPETAQQKITLGLLALPALIGAASGTALARWPVLADIGFLCLAFGAVNLRRGGARWMTLGMVGFIAYFLSQFLHPSLDQLVREAIGVALGIAAVYLVRFVLLPDHPAAEQRRAAITLQARIRSILLLAENASGSVPPSDRMRVRLRRSAERLNEAALEAEEAAWAREGRRSTFAARIFDAELATERLVEHVLACPHAGPARAATHDAIVRLHEDMRDGLRFRADGWRDPDAPEPVRALVFALGELGAAGAAPEAAPPADPSDWAGPGGGDDPKDDSTGNQPPSLWQDTILRQAIQVTVAAGISIGAGHLVSTQRWYWAALTAFVVLNGTQSRGDTLAKAARRVGGTLGGVLVGVFLATAVAGEQKLVIALILVSAFFAFYAFQAAYGVMIFWITIMIALLYGLMGFFSPGLLVLRVEETLVGAAAAVVTAIVLLPSSSRDAARDASAAFFRALADAVEAGAARLTPEADGESSQAADPLTAVRRLDRRWQALRQRIGPAAPFWMPPRARRGRLLLAVAAACAFRGREFAQATAAERPRTSQDLACVAETAARIREKCELLAEAHETSSRQASVLRAEPLARAAEAMRPDEAAVEARAGSQRKFSVDLVRLGKIERALDRLTTEM